MDKSSVTKNNINTNLKTNLNLKPASESNFRNRVRSAGVFLTGMTIGSVLALVGLYDLALRVFTQESPAVTEQIFETGLRAQTEKLADREFIAERIRRPTTELITEITRSNEEGYVRVALDHLVGRHYDLCIKELRSSHPVAEGAEQLSNSELWVVIAEHAALFDPHLKKDALAQAYLLEPDNIYFIGEYFVSLLDIGAYEEALQLSKIAEKLAFQQGKPKDQVYIKINSALAQIRLGQHNESIKTLEDARDLIQKKWPQKVHMEGQINNNLGLIYDALGKHDVAIKHFKLSLTASVQSGDFRGQAVGHGNIGYIHGIEGNHQEALNHLSMSVLIGNVFDIPLSVIASNRGMANIIGFEDQKLANHIILKTIQDSKDIDYETGVVIGLRDLIKGLRKLNKLEEAESYAEQMQKIASGSKRPDWILSTYAKSKGSIEYSRENWMQARIYYLKTTEYEKSIQNSNGARIGLADILYASVKTKDRALICSDSRSLLEYYNANTNSKEIYERYFKFANEQIIEWKCGTAP